MSINNKVNNTISISIEKILCHSNWNNKEVNEGGILTILVGIGVTPINNPIIAVTIIPINKAPFIFLTSKTPVNKIPIIANSAGPLVMLPKASIVPPSSGCIIMPAPSSPINAINNPIPTEIAFLYCQVLNQQLLHVH